MAIFAVSRTSDKIGVVRNPPEEKVASEADEPRREEENRGLSNGTSHSGRRAVNKNERP